MGKTLLRRLIEDRRLTRQEALDLLKRRALDMGVDREYTLSMREFDRLLNGELKGTPHPVRARVLEAEFGYSIDALLSTDGRAAVPIRAGANGGADGLRAVAGTRRGRFAGDEAAA